MGTINDYLNGMQKRYPDTQEVREQIEELRDTLHLKAEELQSQGLSYEEASRRALLDLGDVTPLLDQVSGNVKTVYINRLRRSHALAGTAVMLGEFLLGWLGGLLFSPHPGINYLAPFGFAFAFFAVFLGIWPLAAHLSCRQQRDKVEVVEMPYRKLMRTALIGWAAISAVLLFINAAMLPHTGIWFIWPVIGVSNWPLGIWLYHRLLVSGRYDAA